MLGALASSTEERCQFPWRWWLVACSAVCLSGALAGSWVAVAALVPYALAPPVLWKLLHNRQVAVVLALYLIGPNPANDLLGQVALDDPQLGGAATIAPFAVADLLLIILLARSLRATRRPVLRSPLLVWIAVVALVPLVSYASAPDQPLLAFFGQAAVFLRGALILLWLFNLRRPPMDLAKDVLAGLVTGGLWLAGMAVVVWLAFGWLGFVEVPWAGDFTLVSQNRVSVPGWGNNILANVLAVAAIALLAAARGRRASVAFLAPFAVMLAAILAAETRAALLVVVLGVLTVALRAVADRTQQWIGTRSPHERVVARLTAAIGACLMVAVVAFVLLLLNPRLRSLEPASAIRLMLGREYPTNLAEGSLFTRGSLYRGAIRMFVDSPVWGQGWGSWGWTRQSFGLTGTTAVDPHGGFFWALAEGGLLGVTVLLIPVLLLLSQRLPAILAAPVAAMVALEFANANLSKLLFSAVWWFLVGSALLVVRSPASSDDERIAEGQHVQ
jgi:hypothetical protein